MKTIEVKNKDGTSSITTERTPEDVKIEEQAGKFHSGVWAVVVIVITVFVYLCIRYGKCVC